MAALTSTDLVGRVPHGRFFEKHFSVAIANAAAADEWIDTGFSEILAVSGVVTQGATDRGVNTVINAQGTGVSAGTNPGDLGIEATGAATVHVSVIGR